jgi:cellulose synthase/poly-beta-1,6-N-acetylglucosamine synthase-like glycosyltransferase
MGKARLGLIIPAFNEAETIRTALERVLVQSFVAEVIVVDDGSTDETRSILETIDDSRIRLIYHEENQGKVRLFTLEFVTQRPISSGFKMPTSNTIQPTSRDF